MSGSLLADAFAHHVWAMLRLMDTCQTLDADELETRYPGLFGSILDTMRHIVGADCGYLFVMSRGERPLIDEDKIGLAELRGVMESNGAAWARVLAGDPDPDEVLERLRDDGSQTRAPFGIRLAQALHHGSDHRSQICTALTMLGVTPPDIDVWDFGWTEGRVAEVPPSA